MSGWFEESLYNLKHGIAFKGMVQHFSEDPWKWLLYEISPRFYKRGGFSWAILGDEFKGWGIHLCIGFFIMSLFCLIAKLKKWPLFQGFYMIAIYGVFSEIGQMANERFFYFTPINHVLDISFYLLGGCGFYYLNHPKSKIALPFS